MQNQTNIKPSAVRKSTVVAEAVAAKKSVKDLEHQENNTNQDIDPENEVKGLKLVLIHISICLCTFLVGLVSPGRCLKLPCYGADCRTMRNSQHISGFQLDCHSHPRDHR